MTRYILDCEVGSLLSTRSPRSWLSGARGADVREPRAAIKTDQSPNYFVRLIQQGLRNRNAALAVFWIDS